jgi:hypothetical protein
MAVATDLLIERRHRAKTNHEHKQLPMNIKQFSVSRSLKFAAIITLVGGSTLGVKGDSQQHADE